MNETDLADKPVELGCAQAEILGGRICAAASLAAQADAQLLELIGDFDAGNAVRWFAGVASLAHWLSWACSMAPGTAREHVRVARALRRMPTVQAAFAQGRLSYSKVREVTRVVDTVDDAQLCELALRATAAQLAKTVSGYRTAAGRRLRQERQRGLTWTQRESGAVDIRLRLPAEEAALVLAALQTAKDQYGTPPAPDDTRNADRANAPDSQTPAGRTGDGDATPEPVRRSAGAGAGPSTVESGPVYTLADAALDVARVFLATAPEDRSGEDRSLVVVHVNADQLGTLHPTTDTGFTNTAATDSAASAATEAAADVPAGTPSQPRAAVGPEPAPSPAGATEPTPSDLRSETCHVQGIGGIEPDTARRLACDTDLLGAVLDTCGDVLTLGRTRRLVSRAQRRALMIRDQGRCQFTGCHQTRHLKAHHLIHWADGGPTDLANLVLLCGFHHTAVHEGQMQIHGRPGHWQFLMPDGTPHQDWWTAEGLLNFLSQHADREHAARQHAQRSTTIDNVASFHHPDAQRIQPGWRGERYDRHEAVQALFRMPRREGDAKAA